MGFRDMLDQYKVHIIFAGIFIGIIYCFGIVDTTTDLKGYEQYAGIVAALFLIISAIVFYQFYYKKPQSRFSQMMESPQQTSPQQIPPQQTPPQQTPPQQIPTQPKTIFDQFEEIGTGVIKKSEKKKKDDSK